MSGQHDYDVYCYGFDASLAVDTGIVSRPITLPVQPQWLYTLPLDVTMAVSGEYRKIDPIAVSTVSMVNITGRHPNMNIRGYSERAASLLSDGMDSAAAPATYRDPYSAPTSVRTVTGPPKLFTL
jgi:hypothetical protein